MNTMLDKVFKFYHRYRKLAKMIDAKTTTKTVVKTVLGSMVLATLVVLPPTLLAVNMFIYNKLTRILAIILLGIALIWCFLYYLFYYKLLKTYHQEIESINTKIPQYVESSIIMFFVFIFGIIVLSVIF